MQAEKNGSVPLLIGTDLQDKLGFLLVQRDPKGENKDLLTDKVIMKEGTTWH